VQLIEALAQLHEAGFAHGHLSPYSIVMVGDHPKLIGLMHAMPADEYVHENGPIPLDDQYAHAGSVRARGTLPGESSPSRSLNRALMGEK